MEPATAKVSEYFRSVWESYEATVRAHNVCQAEYLRAATQYADQMRRLEVEVSGKESLKKQASQNGLDTTPLDKEIQRLRDEIEAVRLLQAEQQALAAQPPPDAPYDRTILNQVVHALQMSQCDEAVVMSSLMSAAALVEVSSADFELDNAGKVIKVIAKMAGQPIGTIDLAADPARYPKSYYPPALAWLFQNNSTKNEYGRQQTRHPSLFIIEETRSILLPTERKFSYSQPKTRSYESRIWDTATRSSDSETVTIQIATGIAPFMLASRRLEDALKATGGVLCIDRTYDDPFLARVREIVESLTNDSSPWIANAEWPDSDTVLRSIEADLGLVISAPWSDDLSGAWAKFKYTLENGERPRVWRLGHVGHYGMRLRTRDHTWIRALLFVDPSQTPGKTGDPITNTVNPHVKRIGRTSILVRETDRHDNIV